MRKRIKNEALDETETTDEGLIQRYQAEIGDPAQWRAVPMRVRPSGYTLLEIRISNEAVARLGQAAEAEGTSVAEYIARAVEELARGDSTTSGARASAQGIG
jgi:hypothetical protein